MTQILLWLLRDHLELEVPELRMYHHPALCPAQLCSTRERRNHNSERASLAIDDVIQALTQDLDDSCLRTPQFRSGVLLFGAARAKLSPTAQRRRTGLTDLPNGESELHGFHRGGCSTVLARGGVCHLLLAFVSTSEGDHARPQPYASQHV